MTERRQVAWFALGICSITAGAYLAHRGMLVASLVAAVPCIVAIVVLWKALWND
jgi:hypothetical protein